jgi:hypothetical protein
MLVIAGGILLALAILGALRRLPQILLVLFILYLIGSCVGPTPNPASICGSPAASSYCRPSTSQPPH